MNRFALLLLFLAATAAADHFPAALGDRWTYEMRPPIGQPAAITRTVDRVGGVWAHFDAFLGAPRWLAPRGQRVFAWDGRAVVLLYDLAGPVGSSRSVSLPGSCTSGTVTVGADDELVVTPAGSFADCIRIDWRTGCADGGVLSQWFAPGVGLVRWTEGHIAGTIDVVLTGATVGGRLYPRPRAPAPGLSTCLTLDRFEYTIDREPPLTTPRPATRLAVAFDVTNDTGHDLVLTFPGRRTHDIVIVDATGNVVYRHAEDRHVPQAPTSRRIPAGGRWTIAESIELRFHGVDLAPGDYSLEFELEGDDPLGGTAPFRVVHAR